jgi:hypothetical protein
MLTLSASRVTAATLAKAEGKATREQYTETGELMLDPAVILNYKKSDYRHITEIHMGNKGIERIHPNTQSFVNLETLWLSDNRLTKIDNLFPEDEEHDVTDAPRGCTRLKRLYLSNNRISTLAGDLSRLKYLEVLLLANNRLSNMEVVSEQLSHLRFVKQLDLYGNPLSEEQSYRLYFIYRHPSVTLLDMQSVTDAERVEAAKLFGAPNKQRSASATPAVGFGSHTLPKAPTAKAGLISPSVAIIEGTVRQIKMREKARKEFEETKEEVEYKRKLERRRVFHSLWGTKEPMPAGNGKDERPGMSHLFDDRCPESNPEVNKLIDMALEAEQTENAERKQELMKTIQKQKKLLFPERFGDKFALTLQKQKDAVAAESKREYEDKVLQALFLPEELATLTKLFENEKLSVSDVASMRKVLTLPPQLKIDDRDFAQFMERYFALLGYPTTSSVVSSKSAGGVGATSSLGGSHASRAPPEPIKLRTAMVAVAWYLPFVDARREHLRMQLADEAAKGGKGFVVAPTPTVTAPTTSAPVAAPGKGAGKADKDAAAAGGKGEKGGAGNGPAAGSGSSATDNKEKDSNPFSGTGPMVTLKKINFLADHKQLLQNSGPADRIPAPPAGSVVAEPYKNEQLRVGSAFKTVLQMQQERAASQNSKRPKV